MTASWHEFIDLRRKLLKVQEDRRFGRITSKESVEKSTALLEKMDAITGRTPAGQREKARAKVERKPIHFDVRYATLRQANGLCTYCDTPLKPEHPDGEPFVLDHRIPLSRGGTDKPSNLTAACHYCNTVKADSTDFEFICQDLGIEVGWYARLNPEFDELDEDGEFFLDKTAFDLARRDMFDFPDTAEGDDEYIALFWGGSGHA